MNTMEVENVRVVIRIKPVKKEQAANLVTEVDETSTVVAVRKPGTQPGNEGVKSYKFDYVLKQDSSQVRALLRLTVESIY